MAPRHLQPDEALVALHSGLEGLSEAEARRRLAEFGPNRVERLRRRSLLLRLAGEFVHFFAMILWVAAGLCFLAEGRDPGSGMARLGVAILVVILVNGLFAFWQEARAERALKSLEALLPRTVAVRRDGARVRLPAEQLVPGDVVELEDGDVVPADARVLEASSLLVNLACSPARAHRCPGTRKPTPSGIRCAP
jgi:sodium/potassium-transporting ATPase subunit alpha